MFTSFPLVPCYVEGAFVLQSVCLKLGIDTGDRLHTNSRKLKFLVQGPLPPDSAFPPFQDFDVVHNYLQTNTRSMQARLRKRGQKGGFWSQWQEGVRVRTGTEQLCACRPLDLHPHDPQAQDP